MTNRSAVLDLVHRLDLRGASIRLREASTALVRWCLRRFERPSHAFDALSPSAKALLLQLLARETRTLVVPRVTGAAIGLELADVISIYREHGSAAAGGPFVLAVNGWAREELRRHPELAASGAVGPVSAWRRLLAR
jgi:hypothetical protein